MRPKMVWGCTSKPTSSSATMPPNRKDTSCSARRATAATLRSSLAGVEIFPPQLLHRRLARRADVGRVVRCVVDGAHDEAAVDIDVENVDAAGRLLEAAEERLLAGQRVAEQCAVDAAVQDDERDVPVLGVQQPPKRRQRAVEELADRFAAEEAGVERHDAAESGGHQPLHLVRVEAAELAALDLAQVLLALMVRVRGNDLRG